MFFYVWEAASVRAHWHPSFDMHLSYLGPVSVFSRTLGEEEGGLWCTSWMAVTFFVYWYGRQYFSFMVLSERSSHWGRSVQRLSLRLSGSPTGDHFRILKCLKVIFLRTNVLKASCWLSFPSSPFRRALLLFCERKAELPPTRSLISTLPCNIETSGNKEANQNTAEKVTLWLGYVSFYNSDDVQFPAFNLVK